MRRVWSRAHHVGAAAHARTGRDAVAVRGARRAAAVMHAPGDGGTLTSRATHPLHSGDRIWRESNCYVDLWIGQLHHLGLDPLAMLACGVAPQFEIDQW